MLRSLNRNLPRAARLANVAPRPAFKAPVSLLARKYANVAPSPSDSFASGANQYYIEE